MEDREIVSLYHARDEEAINETRKKYNNALLRFARRLTSNECDAEECVNDTYLCAWNGIPPASPDRLLPFLYTICRMRAIDAARRQTAQKRGEGAYQEAYEELEEVIAQPSGGDPVDRIALRDALDSFLSSLGKENRALFMRRYYYLCPLSEISAELHISENSVKARLFRLRRKLKKHLRGAGFEID